MLANPRHRDRFLAPADRIKSVTTGKIIIEPDDTTTCSIRVKEVRGDQQDSMSLGRKPPMLESKSWVRDGNRKPLREVGM